MINKKGFVLMETIVVITVLCVVLVTLFGAYSKILIDVSNRSLYNNTEYVYKSSIIREYLESKLNIVEFMGTEYVSGYCSNQLSQYKNCDADDLEGADIFNFMGVRGIYFILWDKDATLSGRFSRLEPTTQKFISSIDVPIESEPVRMMIVMYASENNYIANEYEYAFLRFGSRG